MTSFSTLFGWGSGNSGGLPAAVSGAGAADAAEDDVGRFDLHAQTRWGLEAGSLSAGAVDILDASAHSADRVVMVILGPRLIARRRPWRVEPAQQLIRCQVVQHGVDRLHGDLWQLTGHGCVDRFSREMRMLRDHVQDGQPLPGDAQVASPQQFSPGVRSHHHIHLATKNE